MARSIACRFASPSMDAISTFTAETRARKDGGISRRTMSSLLNLTLILTIGLVTKGLLVYGKAIFLQPGQEEQRKGISLLKEKYVQYREKFKLNDSIVIVKLEPSKIMNWFL